MSIERRIQRQPAGLGRLLLLFGGETPREIADSVRLVVDTTPYFGVDVQTVATDTTTAALPLTLAGVAANPGKLLGFSVRVQMGAVPGTQLRVRYGYSPNPGVNRVYLGSLVQADPVAGAFYTLNGFLPGGIVFEPGAGFAAEVESDGAGGADHNVTRRDFFENYA